jgi:hypothetical protein
MREVKKIERILKKFLPVVADPPYDDIDFTVRNDNGLYMIAYTFRVPNTEEYYSPMSPSKGHSTPQEIKARHEAYRITSSANKYLGLNLIVNHVGLLPKNTP